MDDPPVTPEPEARAKAVFEEAAALINRTLPAGYQVEIHLRRMDDPSWHGTSTFIWQTNEPMPHTEC